MGFGSGGEPFDWSDAWTGVMTGLAQGITKIGLDYATQELGLNPLIANIGFLAIAQAINAGILASMPGEKRDVFKIMYDNFEKNVLTFLGYADPSDPSYAWQQAAYISQILDFSDIIRERGLEEALNTYATGFFSSTAVNAIVSSGYTIGQYFTLKLAEIAPDQQEAVIPIKGNDEIKVGDVTFRRDDTGHWIPVGVSEDDFWSFGTLGVDASGKLGFFTGAELEQVFGSYILFQRVEDGFQNYAEVKDSNGNLIFVVTPREDGGYNYYNSYGEYVDAELESPFYSYSFVDGILNSFGFTQDNSTTYIDCSSFYTNILSQQDGFDIYNDGWKILNTVYNTYRTLEELVEPIAFAESSVPSYEDPPTGEYSIRFFAKRPDGLVYNSTDVINLNAEDFSGHAFIAIADKDGNIFYRGLYPDRDDLLKLNNPLNLLIMPHEAEIKDDYYHSFNYSESTEWYKMTDEQFTKIITDYVDPVNYWANHVYQLGANNCTDYVLNIAQDLDIQLPYNDGPYSNPKSFADTLLESEVIEALGHDRFKINEEIYQPDGHRRVVVELYDGSVTEITLLHK